MHVFIGWQRLSQESVQNFARVKDTLLFSDAEKSSQIAIKLGICCMHVTRATPHTQHHIFHVGVKYLSVAHSPWYMF